MHVSHARQPAESKPAKSAAVSEGTAVELDRRSEYDVTNKVRTTDIQSVHAAIERIGKTHFPKYSFARMKHAFAYVKKLFAGDTNEFHACDTGYHNLQHTLEVTLAMGRISAGYIAAGEGEVKLTAKHFELGIVCALFHDSGYFRRKGDYRAGNGAVYTKVHVSRGAKLLRSKLVDFGMDEFDAVITPILHFTGYERPVATIRLKALEFRLIGSLLGTADIMSQMADRCYLEKCAKHLYTEFVVGGVARRRTNDGKEVVLFESAEDLLRKTPGFYKGAMKRLDTDLQGVHQFVNHYFGKKNLYFEAITRNIEHVERMNSGSAKLRRYA
jgi:hypothetical protein